MANFPTEGGHYGIPLPGGRFGVLEDASIHVGCAYCGKTSHRSQNCSDRPVGLDLQYDPPQPPPLPAWKQRDEEELRTVRARVAELEARRVHAVMAITRATNELFHAGATQEEFVAYMIEHADDIIDALRPFDSGVRKA